MTLEIVAVNIPTGRGLGHNSPGVTTTPNGENKWETTAKLLPGPPLFRIFDRSGTHDHLGVPPEVADDIELGDLIAAPVRGEPGTVFEILERNGRWSDSFERDPDALDDGRDDWVHFTVAAARDKRTLENEACDRATSMADINRRMEHNRIEANRRAVEELIDRVASADHEQLTAAINAIGPEARDKLDSALEASEPAVAA